MMTAFFTWQRRECSLTWQVGRRFSVVELQVVQRQAVTVR